MKKALTIICAITIIVAGILIILGQQPLKETDNSEQPLANQQQENVKEEQNENKEENNVIPKKKIRKQFTGVKDKEQGEPGLVFSLSHANTTTSENKSLKYLVRNEGEKKVTINFSTSQRYEAILTKEGEGEVYRYSKGRMFMQVLGELNLNPGEENSYSIILPKLQPGDYSLTVFLVGKDVAESSKRTIKFEIND